MRRWRRGHRGRCPWRAKHGRCKTIAKGFGQPPTGIGATSSSAPPVLIGSVIPCCRSSLVSSACRRPLSPKRLRLLRWKSTAFGAVAPRPTLILFHRRRSNEGAPIGPVLVHRRANRSPEPFLAAPWQADWRAAATRSLAHPLATAALWWWASTQPEPVWLSCRHWHARWPRISGLNRSNAGARSGSLEPSAPGETERAGAPANRRWRCPPLRRSTIVKERKLLEAGAGPQLRCSRCPPPPLARRPWWRLRRASGLLMSRQILLAAHILHRGLCEANNRVQRGRPSHF